MFRRSLIFLSIAATNPLQGALTLTVSEAANDGVILTVVGSGVVSGSSSPEPTHFLVFGTTDDSFLADGESGNNDLDIDPVMSLGVFSATEHIYRDNGGTLGLNSYFEFDFATVGQTVGTLDLSTLNGSYTLDAWSFSDFQPGNYTLTTANPLPVIFAGNGLDDITLNVVPEPSGLSLLFFASLGLLTRRRCSEKISI